MNTSMMSASEILAKQLEKRIHLYKGLLRCSIKSVMNDEWGYGESYMQIVMDHMNTDAEQAHALCLLIGIDPNGKGRPE